MTNYRIVFRATGFNDLTVNGVRIGARDGIVRCYDDDDNVVAIVPLEIVRYIKEDSD